MGRDEEDEKEDLPPDEMRSEWYKRKENEWNEWK